MRAARGRVVLAALLALGGPLAAVGAPAGADPRAPHAGACTDRTGITVVVDFTAFGGGVQVRCAGAASSGFDALTKAGFTFSGTQRFPGLLCRIDGLPTPEQDPCVNAPPAGSYWGYWHAERGGDWTYSTTGAGGYRPPAGSVEGWAFGAKAEPSVAPPAPLPAPTTTAAPTPTTAPGAPPTPTTAPSGAGPVAPTAPPTTADAEAPTTTTSDAAERDEVERPGDDRSAGDDGIVEPQALGTLDPPEDGGTGSPAGLAVAAAALAVVGGTALWRRRRRSPAEP